MKNYYSVRVFWLLFITFNISLSYEWIYRAMIIHYSPKYDTFGLENTPFYFVGFGLTSLCLLNKKWAWWVILAGSSGFFFIGIFPYFFKILPELQPGFIDYSEAALYMILLGTAIYLCIRGLFAKSK